MVAGEHPAVPVAPPPPAPPTPVGPPPIVVAVEDASDPARWWKVAVAVLAVLALILGVLAVTGRSDSGGEPAAAVTPEQEAALDEIATEPTAELDAQRAQIEKLQQESAAATAAAQQLEADNAALQKDLDAAVRRAEAAEKTASVAIEDAGRNGDSAADAGRQVTSLTRQVEALNREIGALTSETARLTQQNAKLEQANGDLATQHEQATAQLTALDGVHAKTYACTQGLADAVRHQEDPSWWEEHGDTTTQTCVAAQDALDAHQQQFG